MIQIPISKTIIAPDGNYKGQPVSITFNGIFMNYDKLSIVYGRKKKPASLFWTGVGHGSGVYLQQLHGGSYGDVKLSCDEFANLLNDIGAINELQSFNKARTAWEKFNH